MTKSTLFKTAHALTRNLVSGDRSFSYRSTFGLVLRHFAAEAKAPATETFPVIVRETERRKDGSVSGFKGSVLIEGHPVPYSTYTRLTDDPADVLKVRVDRITLGGRHLRSVRERFAQIAASSPAPVNAVADRDGFDRIKRLGTVWERGDKLRVYFPYDTVVALAGLRVSYYGTGNVCSASLDGVKISNSEAGRRLIALEQARFHYDATNDTFGCSGLAESVFDRLIEGIEERAL